MFSNNEKIKILYKLSCDALAIMLVILFFSLISEGVLPGFLSAHLSFSFLLWTTTVLAVLSIYLEKKFDFLKSNETKKKKFIIIACFIFCALIISSSLLNFSPLQIITITIVMTFIIYYLYKEINF